jgi:hypothetical protein
MNTSRSVLGSGWPSNHFAPRQDVRAILLAGMGGLFCA